MPEAGREEPGKGPVWGPFPGWGEGGDPAGPGWSDPKPRFMARPGYHAFDTDTTMTALWERTEPHRRPTASVKLVIRDLKEGGLAHLPSGDFQRQRRLARLRRGSGCCGQCGRWRYFRGSGRAGSLWKVSRYVQNAVNFLEPNTTSAVNNRQPPSRTPTNSSLHITLAPRARGGGPWG